MHSDLELHTSSEDARVRQRAPDLGARHSVTCAQAARPSQDGGW